VRWKYVFEFRLMLYADVPAWTWIWDFVVDDRIV
jgi:hypothetical protein